MNRRIVIIGGVAAGPKAAARARRLDQDADITIVEKDELLSYAGCALPYYISGVVDDRRQLTVAAGETLTGTKRINVLSRTLATAIDRAAREVEVRSLESGQTRRLPYDKLIIATGAEPLDPPIPGKDLANVWRLKRVEDADRFKAFLQGHGAARVVIVGGGLIGMEMADAVVERKGHVTVVEMLPHVLPMLDADVAALVEKRLREAGVEVVTAARVERFEGDETGRVRCVVTGRGAFEADVVLLSVGIKPNVELARRAGLLIGPSGAIHVDETMRTSDPNIYAAGDCAEKQDTVRGAPVALPLGSVANKEGRVAGSNAVGHAQRFPGVMGATALKVFDWNVGRSGLSAEQAAGLGIAVVTATVAGSDRPGYFPGSRDLVLKLIADRSNRRLIGIQGVGPGDVIKRIDVATTAMTARMTVDDVANLDLAYAPPYSEAMDLLIDAANTLRNKLDGLLAGITATQLQASRVTGEDMVLLDVRNPDEHRAVAIPGSTLIPLPALRKRLGRVPRDRRVIVYCRSSTRAWEACRILAGHGYDNVELLDGGMMAWPFETAAGPGS